MRKKKKEWDAALPAMLFALRSVAHESTGFSPAELVYGRALRSPLRLVRENWEEKGSDPTVVEYVCNLLQRLYDTQALVEANMLEAQTKAKKTLRQKQQCAPVSRRAEGAHVAYF